MKEKTDRVETMVAVALFFGFGTGIVALLGGLYGFLGGRWEAGGLCFLAAALAFGLIANALLRD